jgi:TonB family protein
MSPTGPTALYSRREIALAAGVSEAEVLAVLGPAREFVPHDEAVQVGRLLADADRRSAIGGSPSTRVRQSATDPQSPIRIPQSRGLPLAVSSTLHVGLTALIFLATFNLAPRAATLKPDDRPAEPMRLVFLATPGPGGGGGGGGLLQKAPPPKAKREGHRAISSPLPLRVEPKPVVSTPKPPEPKPAPPLKAEPLPAVIAPIITAPADTRSRIGVLTQTTAENDSHGPGAGGGAGTGKGAGLGEGDGSGIGPGSGGGTGGGPYRPGSGVEPPRLLREVKADYTEDARQRGIAGDVVLEIVVRRDGTVGDVRILQGLGGGLNDRAVQAVRQWRFSPARRLGTAVDVIVEVAVEFKLR